MHMNRARSAVRHLVGALEDDMGDIITSLERAGEAMKALEECGCGGVAGLSSFLRGQRSQIEQCTHRLRTERVNIEDKVRGKTHAHPKPLTDDDVRQITST
jgi:hypothetical protein